MACVLVIEDNKDNRELMVYLLKYFGHRTLVAPDGEAGIDTVAHGEDRPDLIVCDIHMPKMDGYEVAKQLKGHPEHREIPLIAVTSSAMVGDGQRILCHGFDGYMTKPIDPATFVQQLEEFMSKDIETPAGDRT
ncbi:response regulator [Dyella flagellata]|uniref:Response regulator n=2 Tax=Dyella flagellata TaxID=1867833 RepID=A0ABQ5XE84_9GAMM|nr:response regulator [Dyella flagellata]